MRCTLLLFLLLTNKVLGDIWGQDDLPNDPIPGFIQQEHKIPIGWSKGKYLELRPTQYSNNDDDNTLVIYLHGAGRDRKDILDAEALLDRAVSDGFLILAVNVLDWFWWMDRHADYIEKVIDWAVEERGVDPTRVACIGFSSGGVMMYSMLLRRPGIFRAGVAFHSNLPISFQLFKDDYIPTPIMTLHGTTDQKHPFNGGFAAARLDPVLSAENTVSFWVDMNQADPTPTFTEIPDIFLADQSTVQRRDFVSNGSGSADVRSYITVGAGHVVPSRIAIAADKQSGHVQRLGGQNNDIDGYEVAWSFISAHL